LPPGHEPVVLVDVIPVGAGDDGALLTSPAPMINVAAGWEGSESELGDDSDPLLGTPGGELGGG